METINRRTKDVLLVWMFLFLGLLIGKSAKAQSQRIDAKAMEKLALWEGEWKGEGWQVDPSMKKTTFTVTEMVESKLNGLAMSVEGIGIGEDGQIGHHAIGTIFYDIDQENYIFQSVTNEGYATTTQAYFNEAGAFVWGFDIPNGQIRYTIKLTQDEWIEKGEYSADGQQWWPMMEMKLKRVK